jgi:predicted dehydrogenase
MADLKFAVFGTGWWSHFQIPAWFEVGGVELVALYNRTVSKAEKMAERFDVPRVYGDPEELLQKEELDFIDIITEVQAHAPLVYLAAKYKVPVICQKPMGPDYGTCQKMVRACQEAGVPFLIHENLRWHTPIRAVKRIIGEGQIGQPFRARLRIIGYDDYANQPLLKTLENLVLADLGSHLFDTARFLFGEAQSLYCQHHRTRGDIVGEDVATVMLKFGDVTCICEMSNATRNQWGAAFPAFIVVEGTQGTLELGPDYWIRIATEEGHQARRYAPPTYPWADNQSAWHASIVDCNEDLLQAFNTGQPAETSGRDNLKTMRLLFSAYESAARDQVITFN